MLAIKFSMKMTCFNKYDLICSILLRCDFVGNLGSLTNNYRPKHKALPALTTAFETSFWSIINALISLQLMSDAYQMIFSSTPWKVSRGIGVPWMAEMSLSSSFNRVNFWSVGLIAENFVWSTKGGVRIKELWLFVFYCSTWWNLTSISGYWMLLGFEQIDYDKFSLFLTDFFFF